MEPLFYLVALWVGLAIARSARELIWHLIGPSIRYIVHHLTGY